MRIATFSAEATRNHFYCLVLVFFKLLKCMILLCVNFLFVNGLWQHPPDCMLPSLVEETPSELAVPWAQACFVLSACYPDCSSFLSVLGPCPLSCTSTAVSGIVLVQKATCMKIKAVNKRDYLQLGSAEWPDLQHSPNNCCRGVWGRSWKQGWDERQMIPSCLCSWSPTLWNCSCECTCALAQLSEGIPLQCLK